MWASRLGTIVRIGLVTAVTLAAFGVLELAVRLAGIQPARWPSAGGRSVLGAEVDPLLGAMLQPEWSGQWTSGFQVETDERRFRITGHAPPKSPRARVAFLGDSCTFGWGVDTPGTYIARIDELQRRNGTAQVELINAAYPGDSAVVGLYKLRERVLPLAPDVVVLAFSANNAFRLALVSDAER